MRILFTLTYSLLWALIVLEAVLLREVLRKTVWFKQLYIDFSRRPAAENDRLAIGTRAPDFTAPLLGTGEFLSTSDFKGNPSILLFVSMDAWLPFDEKLAAAIHAIWHKAKGHLCIVCIGTTETCQRFSRDYATTVLAEHQVPILVDEGGLVAQSFQITSTLEAVQLDENLGVKSYGRPESSEQEEDDNERDKALPAALPSASHSPSKPENENAIQQTSKSKTDSVDGGNLRPCDWPDDLPSSGASFNRVDTTVSCVMTRFRLRSAWSLIPFYLAFRRVRRSARDVGGLMKAVFLIEDVHTCYTLSVWRDECAIMDFGRVHAHTSAAGSAFGPTWRKDLERSEIWSAQFRLWAVSAHNLNWEGLDLKTVIADQWSYENEAPVEEMEEEVA